jgi:hypothetical protein
MSSILFNYIWYPIQLYKVSNFMLIFLHILKNENYFEEDNKEGIISLDDCPI